MIRKVGGKYKLIAKGSGRVLGTHSTRAGAVRQERAIQVSKAKKR